MKGLAGALLAAQRSVEKIDLDGKTKGEGAYRYASGEQIIAICRDALHAQGLALVPLLRSLHVQELTSSHWAPLRKGAGGHGGELSPVCPAVVVSVNYRLVHAETGEAEMMSAAAAHGATIDRRGVADLATAGAAAYTYALRDLLRDLLLAPKGRDRDSRGRDDDEEDEPRRAKAPAPRAAETAPPPPPKTKPAEANGAATPSAAPVGANAVIIKGSGAELIDAAKPATTSVTKTLDPPQAPGFVGVAEGSLMVAALVGAGWLEEDAQELSLSGDGVEADPAAAVHIHKALLAAVGLERTRAAWKWVGLDSQAVCRGERLATWGQLRNLALARGAATA